MELKEFKDFLGKKTQAFLPHSIYFYQADINTQPVYFTGTAKILSSFKPSTGNGLYESVNPSADFL